MPRAFTDRHSGPIAPGVARSDDGGMRVPVESLRRGRGAASDVARDAVAAVITPEAPDAW